VSSIDPRGIRLIQRLAQGDSLNAEERESMRATMYLLHQTVQPVRDSEMFSWQGEEAFLQDTWPLIKERLEIESGLYAHGAVSP
jgi:hypothetical protein